MAPVIVEPAKPKDAADIAVRVIEGKVGALVHVERVRHHPSATKLLQLGAVRDLLEGTDFDPLRDVERVFVAGPSAADPRAIVFAEHSLAPERIPQIVRDMVNKSEPKGEVLTAGPEWRVRVQKKGRGGIVAFIPPRFVVMVPEDLIASIDAFDATGGLPGPTGDEAAKVFAVDPSRTLRAKGVPAIPPTVSSLSSDVFVDKDGSITLDVVGQSTTESASDDAEDLTRSIDDATSVGLGFVRLRAFRPLVFRPSGDRIVSHHELSPSEVSMITSFAASYVE